MMVPAPGTAQRFSWELRLRREDKTLAITAAAGSENCVAIAEGNTLHVLTHEGVREVVLPVPGDVTDLAISLDEQWFAYCSGSTVGVTSLDSSRGSVHQHVLPVKKICWSAARPQADPLDRDERLPPHIYFADSSNRIFHFPIKRDMPRVVVSEKHGITSLDCFGPALVFTAGGVAKIYNTLAERVVVVGTNRRGGGSTGVACLPSVVLPNGVDSDEGMPSPGMGIYVSRTSGRVWVADTAGVVHKAVSFPRPSKAGHFPTTPDAADPGAATASHGDKTSTRSPSSQHGGGGSSNGAGGHGAHAATVHPMPHLVNCHFQTLICCWGANGVGVLDIASGAMTALATTATATFTQCVVSGEYVYVVADGDLYSSPLPCSARKIGGALGGIDAGCPYGVGTGFGAHRYGFGLGGEGGSTNGADGAVVDLSTAASDVKSMASISSSSGWEWFRHRVLRSSSRRGTSSSALHDDTSITTEEHAAGYLRAPSGLGTCIAGSGSADHDHDPNTPGYATPTGRGADFAAAAAGNGVEPWQHRRNFVYTPPPPSVQVRFPGGAALTVIKPPGVRGQASPFQDGIPSDNVMNVPQVLFTVPQCGCAAREWIGSYVMVLCETAEVFRDVHGVYQQQLQACSARAFALRNERPCSANPRCGHADAHDTTDDCHPMDLEDNLLPYIDPRWCAAGGLLSRGGGLTELDSQVLSLVIAQDVDPEAYPHALADAAVYLARLPELLATGDVNGIIYMTLLANRLAPVKWGLLAEACRVLAELHPQAAHHIIGDTAPAPRPLCSDVLGGKTALRTQFAKPPAFLDAVERAARATAAERELAAAATPSSHSASTGNLAEAAERNGGEYANVGRPNANALGVTGNLLDEVLLVLLTTCDAAKADPDLVYFVFDRLATQANVERSTPIAGWLTSVASQPHIWANHAPAICALLEARGLVDQLTAFYEVRLRARPGYGNALLRLLVAHRRDEDLLRILERLGGRGGFAAALALSLDAVAARGATWCGLVPGEVAMLACKALGPQDALALVEDCGDHPGWGSGISGCGACINALCTAAKSMKQRQAAVKRAAKIVDDAARKVDVVPSMIRVLAGEENKHSPRRKLLRDCQTAVKVSDPATTTSAATSHWTAVVNPEQACPICSSALSHAQLPVVVQACGHAVHQTCLHSAECPVCAQRAVTTLVRGGMPMPLGGTTVTTITDTVYSPHPESYIVDVRY